LFAPKSSFKNNSSNYPSRAYVYRLSHQMRVHSNPSTVMNKSIGTLSSK